MELLYLLGLVWILFVVYKLYFKPVKTYEHVVARGFFNRVIGMKGKEKQVYLYALEKMNLSENERRDLMFILGIWYANNKNYSKAVFYFEEAFKDFDENFHYKKEFHKVIDTYMECNKKEKAKEVLNFFLERKSFDNNFKKLEKKYKDLVS